MTIRLKELLIGALLVGVLTVVNQTSAQAITNFKPGNIISDAEMSHSGSMTVTQIQNFLNSKVVCDTYGQKNSEYGGPDLNKDGRVQRWEWGKSRYNQTVFPCLRDYKVPDGRSAAKVIYDVAQKYRINPKVLIVLLQKEQGLVTDTWPLAIQFRSATGYGCPDTAACDSKYYGLVNQLDWAGKMYRSILDVSPYWYSPYVKGYNGRVYWHPTASCGSTALNIENWATAGLYSYTPYRPNQAALNAGYGTGNSCSSYGNRNFYLYYRDWFGGSSQPSFVSFVDPRYMELRQDIYKKNVFTGQNVEVLLNQGRQIRFASKITVNGKVYYRTEHDTGRNVAYGIEASQIKEIGYQKLSEPKVMEVTEPTYKISPQSGQNKPAHVSRGVRALFIDKITVAGNEYYRTEYNYNRGENEAIPLSKLKPVASVDFANLLTPRYMRLKQNTTKTNVLLKSQTGDALQANTDLFISGKANIDGVLYFQVESDQKANNNLAIPASEFSEITFTNFIQPRSLKTKVDTSLINPLTQKTEAQVSAGNTYFFNSKTTVNGQVYYRTEQNTKVGSPLAFRASDLAEVTTNATSVTNPQYTKYNSTGGEWLQLIRNTRKVSLANMSQFGELLKSGRQIFVMEKISINGKLYYRTRYDTKVAKANAVIPASDFTRIKNSAMITPRRLKLRITTRKVDPRLETKWGVIHNAGVSFYFVDKTVIDGQLYLRAQIDQRANLYAFFPYSQLQEM